MSFFSELKRRNVFRVAVAYVITAWLIAQAAGLSADSFGAPAWVMKMIITMLVLGAPVALVMAWAYEMTPEGLRRDSSDESGQSATQSSGKLDRTIMVALIAALAYIAYDRFVIDPESESASPETAVQQPAETIHAQVWDKVVPGAKEQSIAVLPFINMSDDAGNEYFSEGLSEELLNQLVKITELRVAARTSSFSFKGKSVTVAEIAKKLDVTHVLEGSVRKSGDRVRITAQLIKADDGFHLWSETYDRTLNDIFVTQDEIAAKVVAALKVSIMGALPETRHTDPEAYSLHLQGKYFRNLGGRSDLEKAIASFEQALSIDPEYAPAWVGLSVTYQSQRRSGFRATNQAFALSMAATEKALAIDDKMATAWANLAYLKRRRLDWAGAEAAIDVAIALEPNNSLVIGTAASLAGNLGQLETSIELFERNIELNPLSLPDLRALGIRYSDYGRFDKALELFNRIVAINPDYPAIHIVLGSTYLAKGDLERALKEIDKNPSAPAYAFVRATILSKQGKEAEAQAIINELLHTSAQEYPVRMAITYAWQGENDAAFAWYEKGLQQDPGSMAYFLARPWNKGLESDPRYPAFVEKLGLLEAWKAMPKRGEQTP